MSPNVSIPPSLTLLTAVLEYGDFRSVKALLEARVNVVRKGALSPEALAYINSGQNPKLKELYDKVYAALRTQKIVVPLFGAFYPSGKKSPLNIAFERNTHADPNALLALLRLGGAHLVKQNIVLPLVKPAKRSLLASALRFLGKTDEKNNRPQRGLEARLPTNLVAPAAFPPPNADLSPATRQSTGHESAAPIASFPAGGPVPNDLSHHTTETGTPEEGEPLVMLR